MTLPPLATIGIGSLPHTQLEMALQQALALEIPYLPSIPMRDPAEFMIPQAVEGLPGMAFDREGNATVAAAGWEREARRFGEALDQALETKKLEPFEPSAAFCAAWKPFLWEVEQRRLPRAKVQITGPITARWGMKLRDGRPLSALPELERQVFRLVLARALAMARAVRERGAAPILFLDEPGLYAFDRKSAAHMVLLQELKIVILALQKEGAAVGLHCCANTEWAQLFGLGLNVVSLDARLSLGAALADPGAFARFIAGGGMLALGIVPTNVASTYDIEGLCQAALAMLRAHGAPVSQVLAQTLLTPACGLALRSVPDSERVFEDLEQARAILRRAI